MIKLSNSENWIDATQVTKLLGISKSTLYAYVSRNVIDRIPNPNNKQQSLYNFNDIAKLLEKKKTTGAEQIAQQSLTWGTPVLESSITLIQDNMLYYRGISIEELIKKYTFEQVASLIWKGNISESTLLFENIKFLSIEDKITYSRQSIQHFLIELDRKDLASRTNQDLSFLGAKIIQSIVTNITKDASNKSIGQKLAQYYCPKVSNASNLISTYLILIADHELNASSFTARVVASTGANLYQVIIAGLSALSGHKHGANVFKVEAMMNELSRELNFEKNLRFRLDRGESIVGFGHNLYPKGDIRAKLLLKQIENEFFDVKEFQINMAIKKVCSDVSGLQPNIDYALYLLVSLLGQTAEFAFFLFALGRIVGWVGQAIEEYNRDRLIRPRAKYIGLKPLKSDSED